MAYYPQRKQKNFFNCYDYDDEPEHRIQIKSQKNKVKYMEPIYQQVPQTTYIQAPQQTISPPIVQQQPMISSSIKYTQPTYQQQPVSTTYVNQPQISLQPQQVSYTQQPISSSVVMSSPQQVAYFPEKKQHRKKSSSVKAQFVQTQAYQQQPLQASHVTVAQPPIAQQQIQYVAQPSVQYTQPQIQYTQPPIQYTQPPIQYTQPPIQQHQQVTYLPQHQQRNFWSCYDYEETPHNIVQVHRRKSSSIQYYKRPAQILPPPQYIQQPPYVQQSVQPTYVNQTPLAQQQISFAQPQPQIMQTQH